MTLYRPDHVSVATFSAGSTLSVSASGNTVEKRRHFEGLGRCILGFARIEADATHIFFLHLEDRMDQLTEIMEAATEAH